jgi:hypothetical protein
MNNRVSQAITPKVIRVLYNRHGDDRFGEPGIRPIDSCMSPWPIRGV